MSVELYFSNQLRQLGGKLSDSLKDEWRRKVNILEGSSIIVPNINLKKWLEMEIADQIGVAINLDFKFLENGLWDMLCNLCVDVEGLKDSVEFLDGNSLQLMLLFLLQNSTGDMDSSADMIQNYISSRDRGAVDDHVKRVWQLSGRLAFYFREYEYHRPKMIESWRTNDKCEGVSDAELSQRRLYNKLFDPVSGLCSKLNEKQFMTLAQYANRIMSSLKGGDRQRLISDTEKSVYLFGLSQVSIYHQQIIGFLGEFYDVQIYAFNPCCEFWEDVETPGEQRWKLKKNARKFAVTKTEFEDGELEESDNQLLQWWGKPGRENIKLLSELTDYNFLELYCLNGEEGIDSDSVLHRIQRHILFRTPAGDGKYYPIPQDRSLQITSCPGIYREVETVYNSIIYNMSEDDGLDLTDIAILVPSMEKYKTAITSVFNQRAKHLGYNLVDSTADMESVYGQGVITLLELAQGTFSRKDVFSLLFNPCFQERYGLSRADIQMWSKWSDELNIFHSFDDKDKVRRGYGGDGEHTWQQGLRRLRVSRIMDAEQNQEVSGRFADFRGVVPFDISGLVDYEDVEKFCVVIELLFAEIKKLNSTNYTCKEWINIIERLTDKFLDIPDGYASENQVRQSLFDTLRSLESYDEFLSVKDDDSDLEFAEGESFGLEMVIEFVCTRLKAIPCSYGSYLTGGVTISEMQPMRPIPFKIVYVMGMGEGEFPGKANQSILDLRLAKRRIGDVNRAESNCYMFLEILASTQEKLYITYVSKDLQKDEDFSPCSIVHQLTMYIESEILLESTSFTIAEIPLKGSSINYLTSKPTEISDMVVNYSESDRISCYLENSLFDDAKGRMSEDDLRRVQKYIPDYSCSGENVEEEAGIEKITLSQLKQFLINPAEISIKLNLNIYDEDTEDKSVVEDEPFFSGFPLDYSLIVKSLEYAVAHCTGGVESSETALKYFSDYYRHNFFNGRTPGEGFCERDRDEFKMVLESRLPMLKAFIEKASISSRSFQCIFFGDGNYRDTVKRSVWTDEFDNEAAVTADNKKVRLLEYLYISLKEEAGGRGVKSKIELHGSQPFIWYDDSGWNTLALTTRKRPQGKLPEKYVIEPFLFYLLALSSEETAGLLRESPFNIHVLYGEKCQTWRYDVSTKEALQYINDLVSEFTNRSQFDLLPFEAVTAIEKKSSFILNPSEGGSLNKSVQFKGEFEDAIAEKIELSDLVKLSKAKVPEDVWEKVKKRFTLFFRAEDVNLEQK